MVDSADGERLTLESLADPIDSLDFWMQKLQGKWTAYRDVLSQVHTPHASGPEDTGYSIASI
jgi:hypothetical protein